MRKTMLGVTLLAALPATAQDDEIRRIHGAAVVPGSYIVVLKPGVAAKPGSAGLSASLVALDLAVRHGGTVTHVYEHALSGFAIRLSEKAARALAGDPRVEYVEEDSVVQAIATQNNATWGLDRIDQRDRPLSTTYTYDTTATNVNAYIIDTGIRTTHVDFGGRAFHGTDTVGDGQNGNDCHGHGTHVAGTVGGGVWGVAKGVRLFRVRVLSCSGSGSNAGVIQGVDWVTANHIKPAVANMSLGGGASTALDNAVAGSINAGVTYAIAAGNSNANACNSSPARVPAALTVGSSTSTDARSSFSNFGTCLDIFAPGSSITSAWSTSNTATNTISGTSMAAPHVAGVAALFLAGNPTATPAQVRTALVDNASPNRISGAGTGSPNLLLFSLLGGGPPPPPPGGTVFFDNFETSLGWQANPNGTDTAATGQWARGNPETTTSGVTLQNGTTPSGVNNLSTGPLAGASAGVNDVDGGVTTIASPPIALPSTGTLTLSFQYYLAHLNNATSADFFRVIILGNTTSQVFQELGDPASDGGTFTTASVNISAFAGQTIRIRFEAADASTASLIEAAVDDVRITQQ
jgi:subtilisin family serine protease